MYLQKVYDMRWAKVGLGVSDLITTLADTRCRAIPQMQY
jgi:hypothetical protein